MKAEIGIDEHGVPFLALEAISATEQTLIEHVRERLGIVIGPDGWYRIRGRRFAVGGPAVGFGDQQMEVGKGHPLLPPGAVVTKVDHALGIVEYDVP